MLLFIKFLPVILFFLVYQLTDFYYATTALIISAIMTHIYVWLKEKSLSYSDWITLGAIVIFGSATLLFHNPTFLKWKPTVLFWAFSCGFLVNQSLNKKPIMQWLFQEKVKAPLYAWKRLDLLSLLFFLGLGSLNWYVMQYYSTDTWVKFKLFGILGFILLYCIILSVYVAKHAEIISTDNIDS